MSHQDDFSTRLTSDLKRRAADVQPELLSLAEVRRTARGIRRRRALATGVAATVTAVGVGGGTWALTTGDESADRMTADAPSFHQAGPTPTIEPGTENDPLDRSRLGLPALDPEQLPRGESPQVAWLMSDRLHTPDGRTLELEGTADQDYSAVAPWDDGWLVTHAGVRGDTLTVLSEDGRPLRSFKSNGFVHVTPDRSRVLFNEGPTLMLHDNDSGETTEIFTNTDQTLTVLPVGVSDDGSVHFNLATANSGDSGDSRVWRNGQVSDPSPGRPEPTVAVNGQGFSVRLVELTDFRSCSAVFDADNQEQARTCDFRPLAFSPDGTALLAFPDHFDGFGAMAVALLGEDWGSPLVDFVNYSADPDAPTLPGFSNGVWEDDNHVLLAMRDANDTANPWYVVRLGTDGEAELAAGPIDPDGESGLSLAGG